MRFLGRLLCMLAVLPLSVAPALAGSCGTVYPTYSYGYSAYTPTYYEPEYRKKVILEYQLVPLFAVGYAGQYTTGVSAAPAAAPVTQSVNVSSPCEETSRKLQARLDALEAKLGGSTPAPAPAKESPPPQSPPPMSPVGAGKPTPVLVGKCASCHDTANAAGRGKGVVLFDGGSPTTWTSEVAGKVLREVSSGRMPKGGKLSPEDFSNIAQELFDLSSK